MNLADNLHYLRKRDKVTQEELAERLGVSRQSVSKWETGEAYPETDKLILLCDIFGVSLDDLVRTNLTLSEQEETETPEKQSTSADEYITHMNKFSRKIAIGVFLILIGVGLCVTLSGFGTARGEREQELFGIFGGGAVILFVAFAVFLFVVAGMEHDRFCKGCGEVADCFSDTQVKAFEKRFAITMASLISGILIDVVFLVTLSSLIDMGIISTASQDAAQCFVVAAFMFILAFTVGGIVYMGIQHAKYHVQEFNRQLRSEIDPPKYKKIADTICAVVMLTATAVFLLIGFVWNIWHPSWVVFPIGGIICAIVSTIASAKRN